MFLNAYTSCTYYMQSKLDVGCIRVCVYVFVQVRDDQVMKHAYIEEQQRRLEGRRASWSASHYAHTDPIIYIMLFRLAESPRSRPNRVVPPGYHKLEQKGVHTHTHTSITIRRFESSHTYKHTYFHLPRPHLSGGPRRAIYSLLYAALNGAEAKEPSGKHIYIYIYHRI